MSRVSSVLALGVITLAGAGCNRITDALNDCVDVKGEFNPAAPAFIVDYQSGVDPVATTARLEKKYSFSARHVYTALPGFAAELSTSALSGVRCEAVVAAIEHDGTVGLATQ